MSKTPPSQPASTSDSPLDREKLVKLLESIGWKKSSEMNGYAYQMKDYKGDKSQILLNTEAAFVKSDRAEIYFMYKDCKAELLDAECVSLLQKDSTSVFINFYGEKL